MELPENIDINKYASELEDKKQLSYKLIYALSPVELKTLKTYIEIYLKTVFIQFFKFPTEALIFFKKKFNSSLQLYINYQDLNNLTIKNRYLLLPIGEFLDQLKYAKHFI